MYEYTWKEISVSMTKHNNGQTYFKMSQEKILRGGDNMNRDLKDEKKSVRWITSEQHFRQWGEQVQRLRGSKGLNVFSEELKKSHVAKRLWTCLRWGWSSRQRLISHVWKPQEGSEQGRHRIRPLWLLLENGLEGGRTELETSQEATRVVLVTGGQWLWWWRKVDVSEIQLGGNIDRNLVIGMWGESEREVTGWFLSFWYEQQCRWKCLQNLPFKRFYIPKIPHMRSLLTLLSAATLPPSHFNYLDHCSFSLVSLPLVYVCFKSSYTVLSS